MNTTPSENAILEQELSKIFNSSHSTEFVEAVAPWLINKFPTNDIRSCDFGLIDRVLNIWASSNAIVGNRDKSSIILTNKSGPRSDILSQCFGERSIDNHGIVDSDDFNKRAQHSTELNPHMLLMLTALNRALKYCYINRTAIGMGTIIGVITRMYRNGVELKKLPKGWEFDKFMRIFEKSNEEPIQVITAVAMIHVEKEMDNRPFFKTKIGFDTCQVVLRSPDEALSLEDYYVLCDLINSRRTVRYTNCMDLPCNEYTNLGNYICDSDTDWLSRRDSLRNVKNWQTINWKAEISDQNIQEDIDGNPSELDKANWKSLLFDCCVRKISVDNFKGIQLTVGDILRSYYDWEKYLSRSGGIAIQDRDFFICVKRVYGDPMVVIGLPTALMAEMFLGYGLVFSSLTRISKQYWPDEMAEQSKIVRGFSQNFISARIDYSKGIDNKYDRYQLFMKLCEAHDRKQYDVAYQIAVTLRNEHIIMNDELEKMLWCCMNDAKLNRLKNDDTLKLSFLIDKLGRSVFHENDNPDDITPKCVDIDFDNSIDRTNLEILLAVMAQGDEYKYSKGLYGHLKMKYLSEGIEKFIKFQKAKEIVTAQVF